MTEIDVYIGQLNYLRRVGDYTIDMIDDAKAWNFQLIPGEATVRETFYHTVRAIIEEAASDFNGTKMSYKEIVSPRQEWHHAIDSFIQGIQDYTDERLAEEFESYWCNKTTVGGAINLGIAHSIGHLAQIRERAGVYSRGKSES